MKMSFERISTSDNLELHGLVYSPNKKTKKAVLQVHGMAGNFYENRFLDYLAKGFTDNGYAFAVFNTHGHDYTADFRKTGIKEEKFVRVGDSYEKFEDCILDIEAAMNFLDKKGYTDIILAGHSLGCLKIAYYQGLKNNKKVRALIFESPPDMSADARREHNFNKLFSIAKEMVNKNKDNELLPETIMDCPLSAATFLSLFDSANIKIFNIASKEKSILSDINLPIFYILGGKDVVLIKSPEEDIAIIKSLATSCPRFEYHIIEDSLHSYFNHETGTSRFYRKLVEGNLILLISAVNHKYASSYVACIIRS